MRCSSAFVALTALGTLILPGQVDAQTRDQQVRQSRPLVLRVRPGGFYGRIPVYLVGSIYKPTSANNITITLPVSSAACRITQVNATLFASPGCLAQ